MSTYDPSLVFLNLGGVTLQGYISGTFINAERMEDTFSVSVGADGVPTRVRNRNKSGSVTITLQAESLSNDYLSSLHAADELSGTGIRPLQITQLGGTTVCAAAQAWVKKPAALEYGTEAPSREWTIETGLMNVLVGGLEL